MSLAAYLKDQIAAWKQVQFNLGLAYSKTLEDIGDTLVFFTPIDTGMASSNWNVGKSAVPFGKGREPEGGDKGAASKSAIRDQVKLIKPGRRAIFSNSMDYIVDLESGEGSPQAPAGMVHPTLLVVDDIWDKNFKLYVMK